MKDMSVEELEYGMKLVIESDAVDLIGKMAITNTWNELLRRYEASKCCGNCKHSDLDDEERVCCLLVEEKGNQMSDYCSDWQTDNLSRAEREGK